MTGDCVCVCVFKRIARALYLLSDTLPSVRRKGMMMDRGKRLTACMLSHTHTHTRKIAVWPLWATVTERVNTLLPYYFTTEARNTFGSNTNCAKWLLSPADDATYARKTTKGVFVCVKLTIYTPVSPTIPPPEVLARLLLHLQVHTHKYKHSHGPKNMHTLTCTHTNWNPVALRKRHTGKELLFPMSVTWSEESLCLCAMGVLRKGLTTLKRCDRSLTRVASS